jgi:hypothetical protein
MRKPLIAMSVLLIAAAGVVRAEVTAEAIPPEVILQFGPLAVGLIQMQFPNPPVKIDPAADKAVGYHVKEDFAVMALPDKNLTAKLVDDAGETEVPVGVIATRALSVQEKDAVVSGDRLAVADFNGVFKIPLFFLSVKAKGADRELEVYSKTGKAILSVPLKKQAGDAASPLNLRLTNIDVEKKKLDATVSLGGAYEGTINLGAVEL